ncbi:MAG TPA: hypothetical protein VFX12_06480 [Vicinamibacterales bacterium]|nr:hypothetical protein [Vicinamibacterales bacterium]
MLPVLALAFLAGNASAQTYSLRDVGQVSFANSGAPDAQPAFLHGLALLHDFEYASAAADFREAEKIDPNFAMAYWGEAMTHNHAVWMEQDKPAALAALAKLGPTPEARLAKAPTEREKDYLRAVDVLYGPGSKEDRDFKYADATAALHQQYPDDVDAAAFYALALLGTSHNGRDVRIYMRAAAVLEPLFYSHPHHPGVAHYLIHAFDDPIHAPLGLDAARAYSGIAPDAAHAQHMTSHIFLALGMWDRVVHANEIAVSVVNRHAEAAGGRHAVCGHYPFWLEYGYLEQGRAAEARRSLAACRDQAAPTGTAGAAATTIDPDNSIVGSYVAMWTRYVLDTQDWRGDALEWTVETSGAPMPHFGVQFTRGFAAVERGDLDTARDALKELHALAAPIGRLFDTRHVSADAWDRKVPLIETLQLEGMIRIADGQKDDGLALLRKAAAMEDAMPFAFGPPAVDKPSYELLGEALLDMKRPAEARAAFESALLRAPRRTQSLLGLVRSERAAGDPAAARHTAAELKQIWHAAETLPADLR